MSGKENVRGGRTVRFVNVLCGLQSTDLTILTGFSKIMVYTQFLSINIRHIISNLVPDQAQVVALSVKFAIRRVILGESKNLTMFFRP